jgi:hypothetical protein
MEINSDAGLLTNINGIANTFSSYFVNIADDLNNNFIDIGKALQSLKKSHPKNTSEMKIIPVTEIEVIDIIKSLKNKNSSGYGGISNNILKYCVNEISKLSSSTSLVTGVYPDRFKFAIVRPIHKKGDK